MAWRWARASSRHASTYGMAHSAELDAAPRAEGGTAGWPSLKQCPLSSPMLYTARGACEGGPARGRAFKPYPALALLGVVRRGGRPVLAGVPPHERSWQSPGAAKGVPPVWAVPPAVLALLDALHVVQRESG